jgi:hypothetical protein
MGKYGLELESQEPGANNETCDEAMQEMMATRAIFAVAEAGPAA